MAGAQAGLSLVNSIIKLGISELAQHSLRLQDAKTENAAIPPVVAAFDADLQSIANAYKSGQADAETCIAALQQMDEAIYQNLHSLVGKPGTAWSESVGMAGQCNRQCTAACCVYYGDLGPPLSLAQIALGGAGGAWGRGDPRLSGTTVQVPEVFASKYGGQDRPAYSISFSAPPIIASTLGAVENSVSSLLGGSQQVTASGAPATGSIANVLPWIVAGFAVIALALGGRKR